MGKSVGPNRSKITSADRNTPDTAPGGGVIADDAAEKRRMDAAGGSEIGRLHHVGTIQIGVPVYAFLDSDLRRERKH